MSISYSEILLLISELHMFISDLYMFLFDLYMFLFTIMIEYFKLNLVLIYVIIITLNLIFLYNSNHISKKEKQLIYQLLNNQRESESDSDSEDSDSDSESDSESDSIRKNVDLSIVILIKSIHKLLLNKGGMTNSEITNFLGLKSKNHNGCITLIIMEQNNYLFEQNSYSKIWCAL